MDGGLFFAVMEDGLYQIKVRHGWPAALCRHGRRPVSNQSPPWMAGCSLPSWKTACIKSKSAMDGRLLFAAREDGKNKHYYQR